MRLLLNSFVLFWIWHSANAANWATLDGKPSMLFGHQGEKVIFPAHTLPAYETAALLGADYVEPDLLLTKDDILVCFHDVALKGSTNVESFPEFSHMMKNYTGIIGVVHEEIINNWFLEDFTVAELRKLRLKQNDVGVRLQYFEEEFLIPTFQEYLDVIHKMNYKLNRSIGIIPELKHPSFRNRNLINPHHMEDIFLSVLQANGYPMYQTNLSTCLALDKNDNISIACPPVIIQNFDKNVLTYISNKTDLPLMLVVHPDLSLLTYKGLEEMSSIISHYCVWKEYMYVGVEKELEFTGVQYDKELIESLGGFIPSTSFVTEAHKYGIRMGLFTINDSRESGRRGCAVVPGCEPENKAEELNYFFNLGVDTLFIENVAESIEMRLIFDYKIERNVSSASTNRHSSGMVYAGLLLSFASLQFAIFY